MQMYLPGTAAFDSFNDRLRNAAATAQGPKSAVSWNGFNVLRRSSSGRILPEVCSGETAARAVTRINTGLAAYLDVPHIKIRRRKI